MKIFSGTSNVPLSQAIAVELGVSLGQVEITRFIDSECRVFVEEDVKDETVFVVQSLSRVADQNLVELCLLGAALKDRGAKKVTAVIPWMGYSKQDKAFRKGEAISAQLVAKFIEAAGFDEVITVELHSKHVLSYFHIPVIEVSTHQLFLSDDTDAVIVSPDKGGASRSERFAKEKQLPVLYIDKSRDVKSGEVTVHGISGDVTGKMVIIFDDIINTGATAIMASAFLKEKGAGKIYFFATHAVLAGTAIENLSQSAIDKIIVTDTIHQTRQKLPVNCSVISVASLLADAITREIQ